MLLPHCYGHDDCLGPNFVGFIALELGCPLGARPKGVGHRRLLVPVGLSAVVAGGGRLEYDWLVVLPKLQSWRAHRESRTKDFFCSSLVTAL